MSMQAMKTQVQGMTPLKSWSLLTVFVNAQIGKITAEIIKQMKNTGFCKYRGQHTTIKKSIT